MCHEYNSNRWHRLTPDITGSYAKGTWSSLPTMPNGSDGTAACTPSCPYRPLYFAEVMTGTVSNVAVVGDTQAVMTAERIARAEVVFLTTGLQNETPRSL